MNEKLLTPDQIDHYLSEIDVEWAAIPGQGLVRVFEAGSFEEGLELLNKISEVIKNQEHYPEITLRAGQLEVAAITNEVGGITIKDVELAKAIDELEI